MVNLKRLMIVVVLSTIAEPSYGDDWPQWLGPQRDGVWRETGILKNFPKDGLKIRWRTPIGAGYSGPSVAEGKVVVTDRVLDKGVKNPLNPFATDAIAGKERILCLEESTGKVLWKHEYDCVYTVSYPAGPRANPLIKAGKVYCLGVMGDLICLNLQTGEVIWSKNFLKDYEAKVPFWGFSAPPLLDGDKLICLVGGAGKVAVAFHKDTGKEIWRALSTTDPGYGPPILIHAGGTKQLIIWDPDAVNSLDPETGKVYWSQPFKIKAALTIPTPRQDGNLLFVTSFYNGSMMIRLDADKPQATVLWKGKNQSENPRLTDGLHAIMSTPILKNHFIYGVCSYGELRCLEEETGKRLWEDLTATGGKEDRWANAFIVAHEDRYFLFNEKGDLIIARMNPQKYEEVSRTHLLEPTNRMVAAQRRGESVVWSHPAFANRSIYARNDKEIVCASLADDK